MEFTLILIAISIAIAALGSRFQIARGNAPTLWPAVGAAFLAPTAMIACVCLMDGSQIFSTSYWVGHAKLGALDVMKGVWLIGAIIALVPAVLVVEIYRHKTRR